jgi:hypothetical protein
MSASSSQALPPKQNTVSDRERRRFFVLGPAGLCQAAAEGLRKQNRDVSWTVLAMLFTFFECLSTQSCPVAMAVLVEGGAVELTVGHMTEAGLDIQDSGVQMCAHYFSDPRAVERMCAPGMVDRLMKWVPTWLAEVRGEIGWDRAYTTKMTMRVRSNMLRWGEQE